MKGLAKRLTDLEAQKAGELPDTVKAWLGWSLTDAERAALSEAPPCSGYDLNDLTEEERQWLAIS